MVDEVKSTTIIPISLYCFLLAIFSLSLGCNAILSNKKILDGTDPTLWLPVAAYFIFAAALSAVAIGILKMKNLCWKILFFSLAICVACMASMILAFVIFLCINANFIFSYFQSDQITTPMWVTFLCFFLSEIIVLYYLASDDVVSSFGGMGELIRPF